MRPAPLSGQEDEQVWRDVTYTVHDGLVLYARDYGDIDAPLPAALCLPGLTRNSRDFHELAKRLSARRRVLALDYRGRGQSQRAGDYRTYSPVVELADTLQLMTLAHVHDAIIIGTSRGGIIAMLMAAARPSAVRAAILNDVGPVIPPTALLRIAGYVRNMPEFANLDHAVATFRRVNEEFFPNLSDAEWRDFVSRGITRRAGKYTLDYDPRLADALDEQIDILDGRIPALWPQFAALLHKPVLVLRGANSDMLSSETVQQMRSLKRDLMSATIPDRGHTPFLSEKKALAAIDKFLAKVDEA